MKKFLVPVLALALSLMTGSAALARPASPEAIVGVSGEILVSRYVTDAGNDYRMYAHLALDTSGSLTRVRTHYHCRRNGVDWDGCRVEDTQGIQAQGGPGGSWGTFTPSQHHFSYPGGSCCASPKDPSEWFANSPTIVGPYVDLSNAYALRAVVEDPDAGRFWLADGTNILNVNIANAVGPVW